MGSQGTEGKKGGPPKTTESQEGGNRGGKFAGWGRRKTSYRCGKRGCEGGVRTEASGGVQRNGRGGGGREPWRKDKREVLEQREGITPRTTSQGDATGDQTQKRNSAG